MAGNFRHIPKSAKEQLVVMSASMKSSEIAKVTGVSHRTVNRVKRLAHATGSVVRTPLEHGRPRLLNGLETTVCILDIRYYKQLIEYNLTVSGIMHRAHSRHVPQRAAARIARCNGCRGIRGYHIPIIEKEGILKKTGIFTSQSTEMTS